MKSFTKFRKASILGLLSAVVCTSSAIAFTACTNNSDTGDKDPVITKYAATLNASINMGGQVVSFADVIDSAYVTDDNGDYMLTVIYKSGSINVYGTAGTVFIDDNPANPTTAAGFADGTLGVYKANGDLVTEGVEVTYSTGENYVENSNKQNVYYVQSAAYPVDALRANYELTMYINSSLRGIQFSNTTYKATLTLNLDNGQTVSQISGLGVATRGTVEVEQPASSYVKYGAELNSVVAMGQDVNFTENLLNGVYVSEKNGKYEITLIFTSDLVNMPFGNTMTGFLTSAQSVDYNGNTVTPVFGYYDGETLVTDGVKLTYSTGDEYVTISSGSYYYVKSMSFTVDELKDNYILSVYIMAGNQSSASSMQFPYTLKSGQVCNSALTLDLTQTENVDSILELLGIDTLGTVEEE